MAGFAEGVAVMGILVILAFVAGILALVVIGAAFHSPAAAMTALAFAAMIAVPAFFHVTAPMLESDDSDAHQLDSIERGVSLKILGVFVAALVSCVLVRQRRRPPLRPTAEGVLAVLAMGVLVSPLVLGCVPAVLAGPILVGLVVWLHLSSAPSDTSAGAADGARQPHEGDARGTVEPTASPLAE
jgi:hypothetical protein